MLHWGAILCWGRCQQPLLLISTSVLREWFYCFPACVVHSWVSVWLEITGNTVSSWKRKKCRQGQVCVFCMFNYLISLFKLRLSLGLLDPAYWTNFVLFWTRFCVFPFCVSYTFFMTHIQSSHQLPTAPVFSRSSVAANKNKHLNSTWNEAYGSSHFSC